jgi:putative transposase
MPRTARQQPGGVVFHVLNRGNERRVIFEDDGDYAAFLRVMVAAMREQPIDLLCYCLMPNHWHLVLRPREDGDMGRFMQRLTVTHVRRWREHRRQVGHGHLYQGTYKSFPVQDDRHFLTVCRYVERNPLRAGLAPTAEDWPWSSLAQRQDGHDHRPEDERVTLCDWPVDRPRQWLKLVNTEQTSRELEALRASVNRGRPFGHSAWAQMTARRLDLAHTFRTRGRPKKAEEAPK